MANEPNQLKYLTSLCSQSINSDKPIILFGSGTIGKLYLQFLRKNNFMSDIFFCDNNLAVCGTLIEDVPVISFNELIDKYNHSYIIVSSLEYFDEIALQLKDNHLSYIMDTGVHLALLDTENTLKSFQGYSSLIEKNLTQFQKAYDLLSDELSKKIFCDRINYCNTVSSKYLTPLKSNCPQYFDPDIIKLSDQEVFIDGGAYTGDTVEEFLKATDGMFKKVYSFEPEENKHNSFKQVTGGDERIQLMPYGLWSKPEILRFNAQGNYASGLNEVGNVEIPVTSIDEVLKGAPVTFIKMDIEGAELEALKGARESIRKYKPKLAICVYHKPLDIVDIPLYLTELVPEYKIYFRHYSVSMYETVCYAVTN
ncbi:FkbM family methyltransferase [Paenibacillus sp. FSL R5-0407]|uniref:FkbM family methyltransferase n=1 Tax=Paenibacillus sp. FSL R5-0407 TaxID=2975320 RepID=UPI0030F88E64